jgi:hypothetical protein
MKKVNSDILLTCQKFVRTRAPRGKSQICCDFCYKPFRNKELRNQHPIEWRARMFMRSSNYHQTCYVAYLHITALALFQEINAYGRNYRPKRTTGSKGKMP